MSTIAPGIAAPRAHQRPTVRIGGLGPVAAIALVLVVFFTTHSFRFLFVDQDAATGLVGEVSARSNPVYALFMAVQAGLIALLFLARVLSHGIAFRLLVAMAACLFIVASTLWSNGPGRTLANGIILTYVVVAAYVASAYFTPRQFVRVYFRIATFIILASFVLFASAPELAGGYRHGGQDIDSYQFSGITGTKDHAGLIFTFAASAALLGSGLGVPLWWRIGVAGLSVAGLAISNSATSMVIFLMVMAFALIMKVLRAGSFLMVRSAALFMLLLVLVIPFVDLGAIVPFELFGRDASLTGRDQLWVLAIDYIKQRPILGHGYYGFFDTNAYSPAWSFWENFLWWFTDRFHNTALDLAVGLGVPGVALFTGICVAAAGIVANSTVDVETRAILILIVIACIVSAMTNFTILSHNHLATFLMFYAAFAAAERYGEPRPPARPIHRRRAARLVSPSRPGSRI